MSYAESASEVKGPVVPAVVGAPCVLVTERLILEPITLPMVEAVMRGDPRPIEALLEARLPDSWPDDELIHRGFGASLEAVRADATRRLWGDRLMITRDGERRIVGSVIFHGYPCDGVADVGYGVEASSRGRGFATEGTRAAIRWALSQPGIDAVRATTTPLNRSSLRVIEKAGMKPCGIREHELIGELWEYWLRRDDL